MDSPDSVGIKSRGRSRKQELRVLTDNNEVSRDELKKRPYSVISKAAPENRAASPAAPASSNEAAPPVGNTTSSDAAPPSSLSPTGNPVPPTVQSASPETPAKVTCIFNVAEDKQTNHLEGLVNKLKNTRKPLSDTGGNSTAVLDGTKIVANLKDNSKAVDSTSATSCLSLEIPTTVSEVLAHSDSEVYTSSM